MKKLLDKKKEKSILRIDLDTHTTLMGVNTYMCCNKR